MTTRSTKTSSKAGPKAGRNAKRPAKAVHSPIQPVVPIEAPPLSQPFPVVGVGASAGGLEAFTALLKELPADTGMAFVFVQHMDPAHESALSRILSRATGMLVEEVTADIPVKPDHVYVMPSHADMTIAAGVLQLAERQEVAGRHLPIDRFLCSLAEDQTSAAIGIILSGTASDGTLGLKAIKEEGGVTFAQDEKSARHAGMPMSAVAGGCVDFVLPPEEIAAELKRMSLLPSISTTDPAGDRLQANAFHKICLLLRSATGVDFLQYKPGTIHRRIARRMVVQRMNRIEQYVQLLRKNSSEVEALYQDILVHVTGFFRDPDAFEALQREFLPRIAAAKAPGQPFRAWVPGCSTGEEVYSIAILLLEALGEESGESGIQVFGTDISEPAIRQARSGTYLEAALVNVSQARLRRFFLKVEGGYQVRKAVRDRCVFARHDLTKDPPFSNLDLISCRNVLIYLGPVLQKRTVEVFHYALRQSGCLFLGKSESLSAHTDLFALEDHKHKICSRKPGPTPHFDMVPERRESGTRAPTFGVAPGAPFDLKKEAERVLLDRCAPAAIVVDPDLRIVHFQGNTSPFVAPATGEPSFHLLRMLRPELVVDVRTTIQKVSTTGVAAETGGIRLTYDGSVKSIRVEVTPLPGRHEKGLDFLVMFRIEAESVDPPPSAIAGQGKSPELVRLRQELTSTREYLRSIVEDHESIYEDLRAANEEVLSANEELQSTNEELETAKEELQSSNEELTTLNDELQNRNAELGQLANDLSNLLVGVDIPIVILDHGLRIRRFTPKAEKILNLIPQDVGRPFNHIVSNLKGTDWDQLFASVNDHLGTIESEVQDKEGHWYLLRMRPYRTADNRVDGVLMAFLDIDPLKRSLEEARQARDYAEAIVETVLRVPLLVLDAELHVMAVNTSFCQTFRVSAQQIVRQSIFAIEDGQWNTPRLRQFLEELLPQDSRIDDFEMDHHFPAIGFKHMVLSARHIHQAGVGTGMILLAIKDVTEAVEVRKALEASEARYRAIVEDQTELICRFLPDWKLTFVNDAYCRYFGMPRDQLIGRHFLEVGLVSERESIEQHLASFTPDRPVQSFTRQMANPGTPWRHWLTRAFFDEQGRIVEFQSAGRDITELKKNEVTLLRYQHELQALTGELITAQEATNKHVARELHDVVSQKLAVLGLEISALEQRAPKPGGALKQRLHEMAQQVGILAKDIHQMSRQLHPAILDDLGLAAALQNECLAFTEKHGIRTEFTAHDFEGPLREDVSLCLYRVAQESLRNVLTHANAKEVRITLTGGHNRIALLIEDSGNGFEPEKARGKGGLGLISMDERVRLVGGTFTIQSEPGTGTRVEVRVPLRRRKS